MILGGQMAADLVHVMSNASYRRLETLWRNRTLTPQYSRTLLEIWGADKPVAMKRADAANALIPLLTSYAAALNLAPELAAQYPNLGEAEILELAGLPLTFPA